MNHKQFKIATGKNIPIVDIFDSLRLDLTVTTFSLPFRFVDASTSTSFWSACEMTFRDILLEGLVSPFLKSAGSLHKPDSAASLRLPPKSMHKITWEQGRYLVPGAIFHIFAKIVGEDVFSFKTMEPFFAPDKVIRELFGAKTSKLNLLRSLEEGGSG